MCAEGLGHVYDHSGGRRRRGDAARRICKAAGVTPGADLVAEVQVGRIVLRPAAPPFWERIAALSADAPKEELDKVPTDGAAQLDHYLYGHPKGFAILFPTP